MTSKLKPNYAKFMKKPAPLQMSPQRPPDDSGPIPRVIGATPVRKDDEPRGEFIIEAEPVYDAEVYFRGEPLYADREEIGDPAADYEFPPLPLLGLAVIVLVILSL